VSDFCYSWPIFNRVFRQAERMDRMMERLDVKPAVAVRIDRGMAWYEARTRCIDCLEDHRCARWLEYTAGSVSPPDFCPNAQFFRRCTKGSMRERTDAEREVARVP